MRVRKAIIPAAGRGTRMAPFSRIVPKELVPLGTEPALSWVVKEAREAGIEEIGLIVGPGKPLLRDCVRLLGDEIPYKGIRFEFILQEVPLGLAEAMALGREFTAEEPFALLLPDNVLMERECSLRTMVEVAASSSKDVVGIMEIDHSRSGHFSDCGRIEYEEIQPGLYDLSRLLGKKRGALLVDPGETFLRTCGRYVCQPHVYDFIDQVRKTIEGEYSEVPVYQEIIQKKGALGSLIQGPLFDVGNESGYLAASRHLAEVRSEG